MELELFHQFICTSDILSNMEESSSAAAVI